MERGSPSLVGLLDELGRTPSDLRRDWFETSSGKRYRARLGSHVIEGLAFRSAVRPTAPISALRFSLRAYLMRWVHNQPHLPQQAVPHHELDRSPGSHV